MTITNGRQSQFDPGLASPGEPFWGRDGQLYIALFQDVQEKTWWDVATCDAFGCLLTFVHYEPGSEPSPAEVPDWAVR